MPRSIERNARTTSATSASEGLSVVGRGGQRTCGQRSTSAGAGLSALGCSLAVSVAVTSVAASPASPPFPTRRDESYTAHLSQATAVATASTANVRLRPDTCPSYLGRQSLAAGIDGV